MSAYKNSNEQSGMALIVVLVMMLLISVIAVSGMKSITLQGRTTVNVQDGVLLFQASENGLDQIASAVTLAQENTPFTIGPQTRNGITVQSESVFVAASLVPGSDTKFQLVQYDTTATAWRNHDGDAEVDDDEPAAVHSQGWAAKTANN